MASWSCLPLIAIEVCVQMPSHNWLCLASMLTQGAKYWLHVQTDVLSTGVEIRRNARCL